MTSLDDSIISRQNLMLLDNVTNYNKAAIDYFHHKFSDELLELPVSWTMLLKMRKHKLLRLPSCAIEDDDDYRMYLVRLHHCLWRRWSINYYKLNKTKLNPLAINWNKETDVTVLYGPDLLPAKDGHASSFQQQLHEDGARLRSSFLKDPVYEDIDESYDSADDSLSCALSSSVDSHTESIFDRASCLKQSPRHYRPKQSLRFKNTVLKRTLDEKDHPLESSVCINDIYAGRGVEYILHPHRRHSKRCNKVKSTASRQQSDIVSDTEEAKEFRAILSDVRV
ncbi:uncharacterized protein KNAG_0C06400 [Huiozyma naganishii CBS 8797]|uniref:Uncharacterized protein n=1 Tax=Huiozyma naganishii (strain ATCC MYA-139 / BCRC 22969 / CBS 8797 / KCTC 17520 / NBRC 10181 / NCYC 3082 / Yp74L-3) TaxID=1071383 RepID=J7RJP6_HUIN7|nr:hypothetical protein KNAG_0C06400 [Kazachstania naganishii CBS 8797]CCK69733.1 hypothetical protein KNAG_0C06400 [Kazachstania naganishii CBS 8797]